VAVCANKPSYSVINCTVDLLFFNFLSLLCVSIRSVARISQKGVQLDSVDNPGSGGLGAVPPDANNNLIFNILKMA